MMRLLVVLMLATATAAAHPLDVGYLRVEARGTDVAFELEIDHTAAAVLLKTDAAAIDDRSVKANAATLAAGTYQLAPIMSAGGPCAFTEAQATLVGRTVKLTDTARCPGAPASWRFPFVVENRISTGFGLLVKETRGATEKMTLVDDKTTSITLAATASEPRRIPWLQIVLGAVALVAGVLVLALRRRR